MEIRLAPGETLTVLFGTESLPNDGEFKIHYDSTKYPRQLVVEETAGFPGNVKGDASSVLYCESWKNVPTLKEMLDTDGSE